MNNVFKEIPWSTIKVLRFIVKERNSERTVNAATIREKFKFGVLEEQRPLELLEQGKFIDDIGHFHGGIGIYTFRVTAKGYTWVESFWKMLFIYLSSEFFVPAIVAVVVSLITNWLLHH